MAFSKIIAESMDLTDTYAFTGTFSPNNTPAFSAYANADQTGLTDNTWVKLAMNAEFYDTDSKYDVSSYRFTPTVSGKYVFGAEAYIDSSNTIDSIGLAFLQKWVKIIFCD